MNCIKRQKDTTPKEETHLRLEGVQYATGEEGGGLLIAPEKNEVTGPKQKYLWIFLVMKVKSDAVKTSTALEPRKLGS